MTALPEKKCFKCGEVKILSDFYKHPMMADGHVNKCKECNKKDVHKNRADNLEYVQEYDRTRRKKENVSEERWEELSTKRRDYQEAYYEANPEKWEARLAAGRKENVDAAEWEEFLASGRKGAFTPEKWEERISQSRKENCTTEGWEAILTSKRKYAIENPEKLAEIRRKYREDNPKKYRAHSQVGVAIKSGRLKVGTCEVCGEVKVHGHHCDYDKPLEVMWLCAEHHSAWHREHGEGLNAHYSEENETASI